MAVSPSTDNYYIGKGKVSVQTASDTAPRDVGNVPEFEVSFNVETLAHFSSREGVRKKDKEVIIEQGGTLRVVMDEITAENLALAVAGTTTTNTAGDTIIEIFAGTATEAEVFFEGTNDVGQKLNVHLTKVSFTPSGGSLSFISDEWGNIELSGEILADNLGSFGTITIAAAA